MHITSHDSKRFPARRAGVVAFIVLALFATACGSGAIVGQQTPAGDEVTETSETATPKPSPESGSGSALSTGSSGSGTARTSFNQVLEPFGACDAALAYFKAEAIERVGPWGLGGGGYYFDDVMFAEGEAMEEQAMDDSADTGAATSNVAPPALEAPAETGGEDGTFSGTNVQVDGVDEPDFVKTDGRRIITLRDTSLDIFDVTGGDPVLSATLELPTWGQDLLLFGDTVLVIGSDWGTPVPIPFDAEAQFDSPEGIVPVEPGYGSVDGGPVTTITQISIAGQPTVTSTLRAQGQFVSARMIGDIVRLVVTSPPPQLGFLFPQNSNSEDIALEANRRIIEESTLADWMPRYSVTQNGAVTAEGDLLDCGRLHKPSQFAGFNTLSVLTVDIDGTLGVAGATGVIADGQTVYASNNSLYIATTLWPGLFEAWGILPEDIATEYTTSLHRFDITDPGQANYVASGSVSGSMLSQFSLHEWDNRLFVATTEGSSWNQSQESESFITVLEPQGDQLVQVGRVGNMGKGERIFAVRFIASNAYVVTFREVDPLYVVDLVNPTEPYVAGELKVPGFSTYLHPVGDGLLLGVGQDATDGGRTLGAKASLFDVSNPSQPTELDTWVMPNSNSDVEWDHRAFLYWAPRNLAILPVNNWQESFGGAIALHIDRETGITELGRLDNDIPAEVTSGPTPCDSYESEWGDEIQICDPGEVPIGTGDKTCEVDQWMSENPEELKYLLMEFGVTEVEQAEIAIAPGSTIAFCYRWVRWGLQFERILRSIVIDDSLWTVSDQSLQRNTIDTFERLARVEFGSPLYR